MTTTRSLISLFISFSLLLAYSCNKSNNTGNTTDCEVLDNLPDIPGWTENQISSNYGGFSRYHFLDKNSGYALGGSLVHTSTGGLNWSDVVGFKRPNFSNLRELHAPDENKIFVVADTIAGGNGPSQEVLIRTVNGATTWEILAVNDWILAKIHFLDAQNGFAFGYDNNGNGPVFIRSTDGGATWSPVPGVTFPNVYTELLITWRSPTVGLAQTGREQACLTTDGGANWKMISADLQSPAMYYLVDANTIFSISNGQTYRSTDGGTSWSPVDPVQVFVCTIKGSDGLGIALQPDCPDIQPANLSFATSGDGGKTWTLTNPLSAILASKRQEVAPGLFVYYDQVKNIFFWFEKE